MWGEPRPGEAADEAHDGHGHIEAHKARQAYQEGMDDRATETRTHTPPGVTRDPFLSTLSQERTPMNGHLWWTPVYRCPVEDLTAEWTRGKGYPDKTDRMTMTM